jgi:hypothetical protein
MALTQVQGGMSAALVQGTAQASTSGTSIDFTGIPSWVKRITVMFNGVSTSGASSHLIQLGTSGGITSTGYNSSASALSTVVTTSSSTAGFLIAESTAADVMSGQMIISLCTPASNTWVSSHSCKLTTGFTSVGGGDIALASALTTVRITSINGTDTFDAGSINILYE